MKLARFALLSFMMIPVIASATSLQINNRTFKDLSFLVRGRCSTEFGVITANTTNFYTEMTVRNACAHNRNKCEVTIVNSDNCSGQFVGTLILSVKKGIIDLDTGNSTGPYSFTWNNHMIDITSGVATK